MWGCKQIPTPFTLFKLHVWKLLLINTNVSSLYAHLHIFVYSAFGDCAIYVIRRTHFFKLLYSNSDTLIRFFANYSSTFSLNRAVIICKTSRNIIHFIDNYVIFLSINSHCNSAGNFLFYIVIPHPLFPFLYTFVTFISLPSLSLFFFYFLLFPAVVIPVWLSCFLLFLLHLLSPCIHTIPLQKNYINPCYVLRCLNTLRMARTHWNRAQSSMKAWNCLDKCFFGFTVSSRKCWDGPQVAAAAPFAISLTAGSAVSQREFSQIFHLFFLLVFIIVLMYLMCSFSMISVFMFMASNFII
jgi:hypothetical protein